MWRQTNSLSNLFSITCLDTFQFYLNYIKNTFSSACSVAHPKNEVIFFVVRLTDRNKCLKNIRFLSFSLKWLRPSLWKLLFFCEKFIIWCKRFNTIMVFRSCWIQINSCSLIDSTVWCFISDSIELSLPDRNGNFFNTDKFGFYDVFVNLFTFEYTFGIRTNL